MSEDVTKQHETLVLDEGIRQRLKQIRHLALDLDGTLYLGEKLFGFTHDLLNSLREMEIGYTFLTNNSSRSTDQYITRLRSMGIMAEADMIYSSTHATIEYLRKTHPSLRRACVLGTPGFQAELVEAGFVISDTSPELVVVAFDTGLTYERLTRVAYWIDQGLPFIATHPDLICPTDKPTVLPDCGAMCQLLTAATGRAPDAVLGKPNITMCDGVMQRHNLERSELAMVGDRLYTDMKMAQDAGILGVLVLTGETTMDTLATTRLEPDLVVGHAGDLATLLAIARSDGGDL